MFSRLRTPVKTMVGIALAAVLLMALASQLTVFALLDDRLQDVAMRYHLQRHPSPQVPDVSVIAIDEASRKAITEPLAYWQPQVAEVIKALAGAQARAVAIDLVFSAADVRARQESRALAQAFGAANSQGMPVILGYATAIPLPQSALNLLATTNSPRLLGYMDLPADADDFVRRIEPCKPDAADPAFSWGTKLAASARGEDFWCEKKAQLRGPGFAAQVDHRRSMLIPFHLLPSPKLTSFVEVLQMAREGRAQELNTLFAGKLVLIGSYED